VPSLADFGWGAIPAYIRTRPGDGGKHGAQSWRRAAAAMD
jgi:hypothetical protein